MKKIEDHVEDRIITAERQYDRMIRNVKQGIIDKDEILAAMTVINNAHYLAMKHKKRYLIK